MKLGLKFGIRHCDVLVQGKRAVLSQTSILLDGREPDTRAVLTVPGVSELFVQTRCIRYSSIAGELSIKEITAGSSGVGQYKLRALAGI